MQTIDDVVAWAEEKYVESYDLQKCSVERHPSEAYGKDTVYIIVHHENQRMQSCFSNVDCPDGWYINHVWVSAAETIVRVAPESVLNGWPKQHPMSLPENEFKGAVKEYYREVGSWRDVIAELDKIYDAVDEKAMDEARVEKPAISVTYHGDGGQRFTDEWVCDEGETRMDTLSRVKELGTVHSIVDWEETTVTILE